jgi:hypothetical protein
MYESLRFGFPESQGLRPQIEEYRAAQYKLKRHRDASFRRAALPEVRTTDPFDAFNASQARIVRRHAPCSLSAWPSSNCASVISNKLICGTAPAMFSRASILPKCSTTLLTRLRLTQVERTNQRFSVRAVDTSCSFLQLLLISCGQHYSGEIACQPQCRRATDSLACASHDSNRTVFHVVLTSFPKCFSHSFQDNVDHKTRRRVHRCVVYHVRPDGCAHPVSHKALALRGNHAILFRNQEP